LLFDHAEEVAGIPGLFLTHSLNRLFVDCSHVAEFGPVGLRRI